MARKAVADAVEGYLASNWAETAIVGVNSTGEPPANAEPFVLVQYPFASEEQITIGAPGANFWRESGVFTVTLNAKRGRGRATAMTQADEIAALFRGKIIDTVICREASPGPIDDRSDAGNYFVISVAVAYDHDLSG